MEDTEFEAAGETRGLAETLRALRKKEGLTQAALADRAGIHRNTLLLMEQEPEKHSLGNLTKLTSALGVDMWKVLRHIRKARLSVGHE